jgi:hypothetical protein
MTGPRVSETVPGRRANAAYGWGTSSRATRRQRCKRDSHEILHSREILLKAARVLREFGQHVTAEPVEAIAAGEP